ncbi:MAG: hypothetical protein OK454_02745 [Thaumarchaeota archaeon]|nr:hypothetical protein [Nitrososphaerota archaeon]
MDGQSQPELEIDEAGELLFRTYYMMDWATITQVGADRLCVTCGGEMKKAGPVQDKKGLVYEGIVCHKCKTIFWLKRD